MPVEIRELIVRAVVTGESSQKATPPDSSHDEKEIIIGECVDRILQIMKEKQER